MGLLYLYLYNVLEASVPKGMRPHNLKIIIIIIIIIMYSEMAFSRRLLRCDAVYFGK